MFLNPSTAVMLFSCGIEVDDILRTQLIIIHRGPLFFLDSPFRVTDQELSYAKQRSSATGKNTTRGRCCVQCISLYSPARSASSRAGQPNARIPERSGRTRLKRFFEAPYAIAPPSIEGFERLLREARRQAKIAGLKRSDITEAVRRVRAKR